RFSPQTMRAMSANYIGRPLEEATPYDFPGLACAQELAVLPRTYIEADEFDDLRVSARRYAEQRREAGVDVQYVVRRGVSHGHLNGVGLREAQQAMDAMAEIVRTLVRPLVTPGERSPAPGCSRSHFGLGSSAADVGATPDASRQGSQASPFALIRGLFGTENPRRHRCADIGRQAGNGRTGCSGTTVLRASGQRSARAAGSCSWAWAVPPTPTRWEATMSIWT